MSGYLSPEQFPDLNLSQRAAIGRFQDTRSVSVGQAIVNTSKGQRNAIRGAQTSEDVRNWGLLGEPGIKAEQVVDASNRYGLMGPPHGLGETVLRAYSGEGKAYRPNTLYDNQDDNPLPPR